MIEFRVQAGSGVSGVRSAQLGLLEIGRELERIYSILASLCL